ELEVLVRDRAGQGDLIADLELRPLADVHGALAGSRDDEVDDEREGAQNEEQHHGPERSAHEVARHRGSVRRLVAIGSTRLEGADRPPESLWLAAEVVPAGELV